MQVLCQNGRGSAVRWAEACASVDRDDDLALVIARAKMTERFARLTQLIGPIDNRHELAGLETSVQNGKSLFCCRPMRRMVLSVVERIAHPYHPELSGIVHSGDFDVLQLGELYWSRMSAFRCVVPLAGACCRVGPSG